MKFAHIADTHIRNLKFHKEYREIFGNLYEVLKKEEVDYIIHCGDIAHTKTQLSPEFVDMCTDFFRSLADIAPTYIILGNHDGNLKNSTRQDALSPIADALNHPNLYLLKDSGEADIDDNFTLNVLSVFDADNWIKPTDDKRVNIALYHGSIHGCKTDIGWRMEHGENDVSIFDDFDYAFLGDIHKTNQILDKEGRIRYAGSTVQQNHGETNDKGLLIWEILDKEDFTCKHQVLLNPKPFVTLPLTPKGRIPKGTKIPEGARLRLITDNNLPIDKVRRAIDVVKVRFRPESVTFLNRSSIIHPVDDEGSKNFIKENLRDISVQENFIRECLADYEVDDDLLEKIYELNKTYNALAEQDEEVSRNVNWRLNKFEWSNLFNYGEDNSIDFSNLNGIVGIFGKNYSGKSSIIDGLLYTLFNSSSKNERKNLNIINQNKGDCSGEVQFAAGNKIYTISRNSEKYVKRLKGEETLEAKTNVDFESYDVKTGETASQNGLTRSETDKNIRKIVGALEDFLLSSMSSQVDSLVFINEGSTKRKEILAKFLDLEIFEKKFKLAKEDVIDLRSALRRLEGREFDKEIKNAKTALRHNRRETEIQELLCDSFKETIVEAKDALILKNEKIKSIPADIIDVVKIKDLLQIKKDEFGLLENNTSRLRAECEEKTKSYEKIVKFVNNFDAEGLKEKQEAISEKLKNLDDLVADASIKERNHEVIKEKIGLLSTVPCGEEFSHCKFIRDAYTAKGGLSKLENKILVLNNKKIELQGDIEALNPSLVEGRLDKYDQVVARKNELANEIAQNELRIEKNVSKKIQLSVDIENLENKIKEYEDNKEVIENLENLMEEKRQLEFKIEEQEANLEDCQQEMLSLYKEHGSLEQKRNHLVEQKNELVELREKYSAYDLFMRCMHSNGIAYGIIKNKLPVINDEISKVLANVVDFDVFFEDDGRKLDIFIKHPRYDARPIEIGSGAEKTIAAMAIRLALLSVSSLPKSNIFILDEPASALDADNMEGFIRILDMVKNYYQTILLVSHVDSLKDIVDMTIDIDKKGGYAHVSR